jgi:hypothetical protein
MTTLQSIASPCRPETILFIGAGASACLDMPPTDSQAKIIFKLCDKEITEDIFKFDCFDDTSKHDMCQFLRLLDFKDSDLHVITDEQLKISHEAFPEATEDERRLRIVELRRNYDWPALKLIAKARKDYFYIREENKPPDNYLQEIYNMIDVLLKDNRGFTLTNDDGQDIHLSPERLRAAREMMILLGNLMFGCAYRKALNDSASMDNWVPYRRFADTVASLMEDEADNLAKTLSDSPQASESKGIFASRMFYLFSYAILTTNFEPIFLWLFYQAHMKCNKNHDIRLGSPGRKLQLMMDFPNILAMRDPVDKDEELNLNFSFPVSEVSAQRLNDQRHLSDRIMRLGKFFFVHGSSNFRHCPRCGRLNLALGDSWDEKSPTLFAPGPTKALSWGIIPRSDKEREAHRRGEYDAMECLFCGELTHAKDNFMYMQTQLKGSAPSFIKEITDEALSDLPSVKHIVLLGYRLPPDDTIWSATMFALLNRNKNRKVYCSVVCGYEGPDKWLYGDEVLEVVHKYRHTDKENAMGAGAIDNALNIFGKEYVRAYIGGIPLVFHNGDKAWIRELMYPCSGPWKGKIPEFTEHGVVRNIKKGT